MSLLNTSLAARDVCFKAFVIASTFLLSDLTSVTWPGLGNGAVLRLAGISETCSVPRLLDPGHYGNCGWKQTSLFLLRFPQMLIFITSEHRCTTSKNALVSPLLPSVTLNLLANISPLSNAHCWLTALSPALIGISKSCLDTGPTSTRCGPENRCRASVQGVLSHQRILQLLQKTQDWKTHWWHKLIDSNGLYKHHNPHTLNRAYSFCVIYFFKPQAEKLLNPIWHFESLERG